VCKSEILLFGLFFGSLLFLSLDKVTPLFVHDGTVFSRVEVLGFFEVLDSVVKFYSLESSTVPLGNDNRDVVVLAAVELFADLESTDLERRLVVLFLSEDVSSPGLAVSCSRKVSESVGFRVDQFVKASLELRLVDVVAIAVTVSKNNIIFLDIVVRLFFGICGGIVALRAHLEREVELTLALLLTVVEFSYTVFNTEERVARVTNIGC